MYRSAFLALVVAGSGLAGAQDMPPAADRPVDYEKDIQPIFEARCIECHGPEKQKSKFRMDSPEDFMKGGVEGAPIVAGDSANSFLVHLLLGMRDDYDIMPPKDDPLTPEQIGLVRAWVDQGAKFPGGAVMAAADEAPADTGENAEQGSVTGLPADWVVEATDQNGPLATWELKPEGVAGPNGETAIALTSANHDHPATFNLLWTAKKQLENGTISVMVKALSGDEDQGGGLMWRVKDKNNYYVARYNPLEKNYRLYVVKDGQRSKIASADVETEEGSWATLKIEQDGANFVGYLNGEKLLEATDETITGPGGIGYWTKADAATAFAGANIEEK